MSDALCPCDSGKALAACCGPLHDGTPAPTALALMRSRYAAYARGLVDYVLATHDPATRGDLSREATEEWAKKTTWTKLEILATERGGETDGDGVVEFVAHGKTNGQGFAHHERSTFKRIDGKWFYIDGVQPKKAPVVAAAAPGRNDPCPCGSGRKYKKCHGA